MTKRDKFLALVSREDTQTEAKNKSRIADRKWLRESQNIAFKILEKLDQLGWTQKDLADQMNVSPQHVNKIVKGKENLTLETQRKLQDILDIPILASFYETRMESIRNSATVRREVQYLEVSTVQLLNHYRPALSIKVENQNAYQQAV